MKLKGIPKTEEHKRKISEAHKGMKKPWSTGKQNIGKKHTEEWKKLASERMKLENSKRIIENRHNLWKGGKSKETIKIRASVEYKLWRKSVFERDNYTCVWCGVKSGNGKAIILQADHIKPFSQLEQEQERERERELEQERELLKVHFKLNKEIL